MIDCPNCGAPNKDESKFCGDCGELLATAGEVKCPMCGTGNPPESTTCRQCGARLVPLTGPPSEEELQLVEEEAKAVEVAEEEEEVLEPEEAAEVLEPDKVEDVGEVEEIEEAVEAEEIEDIIEAGEIEGTIEAEEIEEAPAGSEGELGKPIPPWLEKLRELPPEETPAEAEKRARLAPAELPEWLEIPSEFEEVLWEAAPVLEEEDIERAEIPSWLEALRPGEAEAEAEEAVIPPAESEDLEEATGLLKGLRGTLAIQPALTIPRRAKSLPPFSLSSFDLERAQTFDRVMKEPARAKAEIVEPRRGEALAATALRWMIYLTIVIAVSLPILAGSNWAAANMGATAPTVAMYDAIEALDEGSVVMVSHDYAPGVAAEMIPQVEAVLNHLMERQVRLINISLTPEGSHLSQQVMEDVAATHGYVYGENYLNLGYVIGAEVGPRSIIEGFPRPTWTDFVEQKPFSEFPMADYVGGTEDIELVVEFAGGPEFLRLWLEQVQGPYQLPMVAGVSATADPFARPYYRNQGQKQLQGLISGLVGAAEYEWQSGQPGSALASMDSQSLAHITIALLILFGNLAYFIGKLRQG